MAQVLPHHHVLQDLGPRDQRERQLSGAIGQHHQKEPLRHPEFRPVVVGTNQTITQHVGEAVVERSLVQAVGAAVGDRVLPSHREWALERNVDRYSAGAVVGFDTSSVTALTQKDAIRSVNLGSPEPLAKPLGE